MNLLKKNTDKLILAFLLSVFFILNANLLLVEPMVWPDEAYLADTAKNILQEGRAGPDVWGNTIIGIRKSLYWYPPIYTNTLAIWFKSFGLSIYNQRILSVIFGMVFLVVIYFFSQNIFAGIPFQKKKLLGLSLVLFLIFDNSFLKSAKMGRPEMMVILLGFLATYIYQLARKSQHKKFLYALTGIILGLTGLTHFLGFFFLLIILSWMLYEKDKKFYFLIIGLMPPVLIWVISVFPNFDILLKQFSLQQSFRTLVPPYIESVFRLSVFELKIIYILYFLLSVICLLFLFNKKSFKYLFLFFGLLAGWLVCLFAKLEWYSVYIAVFLYLLTFVTIIDAKRALAVAVMILLGGLFLINVKIYFNSYNLYQHNQNEYFVFGQKVKEVIPAGKTVYLSTTPDLYFLLIGRNPLYEFPGVKPIEKEYINLLNNSDYLIVNFHLEHLFVGNLLDKYIELNTAKEYSVNNSQYNAQIIELAPKNMRKLPQ
ncbi:MAG: hypothetical protein M1308_08705 [Actinobacteria bacterium]|nr:hypothetical protein [Actinomycetota bacterium]